MKKALTLALALCMLFCSCTGKTEPSRSFICGAADAAAICADGLFTISRGSAKCFDGSGELIFDRELEPGAVQITRNDSLAAACAEGGYSVVFSDGDIISTGNGIICARLSETGHLALCTEEPGYMGSVTVFSPDKKAVYKWYSAHQTLISAAVSPDGRLLAALTGEGIRIFSLDSEAERGSFECRGLRDIVWLGGRVCGIGEDCAYVCDDEGRLRGKRFFSGRTAGAFAALDRKLIIELRERSAAGSSEVCILDDGLDIKNRISAGGEVWSLDCRDDKIALLTQSAASVYSGEGKLLRSEDAPGASMVLLSDGGELIAVGGGSVEMKNS